MGRHRRSGAAPAAEDYAAGTDRRHRGDRRRRSVRTGLLGASAAVAVGAVAVASGLLPGGETLTVGSTGTAERQTQSRQAPELTTQGGATETPTGTGAATRTGKPVSPSAEPSTKPSAEPSAKPSPKPAKTTASPSAKPKPEPTPSPEPKPKVTKKAAPKPAKTAVPKPAAPKASAAPTTEAPAPKPKATTRAPARKAAPASTASRGDAAEAEVLRLVNAERATVGCTPVDADARLASLAGAFSADMAARGFFDHTDPDGATPWTRAQKAGVSTLAGENIARGQADAAAVMKSWMNSDGHRANILNCDFKTMGVGVYFGDGGPWWTQDFGY
ncbi:MULTISPECIES: CAP domain-containing protein [unclassified Streptomyces]|uniref:CAP domain-containing protein n=1 Tax=unclassified Streptomyces TaxID=2593676 RepID=UPI0006AF6461|nr:MULTISPECIES: CAP domain-containing protein [unclassified Streptomyces]KOX35769.1 SCP-like extracellular [Streptomyces sp. NRRL F-6491]KOX41367.1 SCP-like extracellular [Streptomyces sp. NRRL F-6492]